MSRLRKSTSRRVATLANYEEALPIMEVFGNGFSTSRHKVECYIWTDMNGVAGDNGIGYIVNGEWDEDLEQVHWHVKYYTFGLPFLSVHSTGYDPNAKKWWVIYKIKSMQMLRNDFRKAGYTAAA